MSAGMHQPDGKTRRPKTRRRILSDLAMAWEGDVDIGKLGKVWEQDTCPTDGKPQVKKHLYHQTLK